MTIDDRIRNEKLQYDITEEAAKISALSSGKLHKYDILPVRIYCHPTNNRANQISVFSIGKSFR